LRNRESERESVLEASHLVGRAPACHLRLDHGYISARHATIYWSGESWEARDLGSRNGTFVDGQKLLPGQGHRLVAGQAIAFGRSDQVWVLEDDSPPRLMVVADASNEVIVAEDNLLVLPSPEAPQATIYKGSDGGWVLERADELLLPLRDQQTFELGGRIWRVCAPGALFRTSGSDPIRETGQVALHFGVSLDEEHVELRVEIEGVLKDLGSRAHNYLLLTLARRRIADAESGLPATSCGWEYQENLAKALTTTGPQLNVDIFRIRRQFATLGVIDPAHVVERRPRSGQLRVGVAQLVITRL